MSTNDTPPETGRIHEIEIGNGDVVIYDDRNHGAWIQSDDPVDGEEMV